MTQIFASGKNGSVPCKITLIEVCTYLIVYISDDSRYSDHVQSDTLLHNVELGLGILIIIDVVLESFYDQ